MQTIDQLICARWVVPIAPVNTVLDNHAVAIDKGRIIACLPIKEAKQQYEANSIIELSQHAIMPGLVNAHTHNPMVLFRGLADDLPLMDWLNNHIWPAEADVICAESIIDGTKLASAELIRGGTTCYNEHYFFPVETAQAAIDCGIRASIGLQVMNVPNKWAQNEDEYIAKAVDAYKNRPDHELISWTVAPQGPYTNSDSSLTKAKQLADDYQLPMHMHLHETIAELNIDKEKYGKHPIKRLYDLGILYDKFMAVHMVHVNDEELEMLKEKGVHIVHSPESNLKLASGFAPIKKYMDHGLNVCIGTDGAASNNDLDMFSELRTASFLAKAVSGDSTALPAAETLKMATLNGAKALGLDKEIGSIEAGKAADIIAVDLGQFITQPVYNPISHLAYAVNRLQVSDVWIAGKQLLKSGMFTQLDIAGITAKSTKWAKQAQQFQSKASATVTA
ncbi:MAG: TRZ/ATZ family hydrolase [Gammaproteobacteria bacterium]|nr:TRZ/ATZ family hydrolase [Gammaproteobacteria bacterium]MCH9744630.1 TRZ/ATZ family hydrolase [Gammaproteobacteria bacterium]